MGKVYSLEGTLNLEGIIRYSGDSIECLRDETGRPMIRVYTQCGHDFVDIDLLDLGEWLKSAQGAELMRGG